MVKVCPPFWRSSLRGWRDAGCGSRASVAPPKEKVLRCSATADTAESPDTVASRVTRRWCLYGTSRSIPAAVSSIYSHDNIYVISSAPYLASRQR